MVLETLFSYYRIDECFDLNKIPQVVLEPTSSFYEKTTRIYFVKVTIVDFSGFF